MAEVERFTNEVTKDYKDKGIDYLVLSAGGPPTGNWRGPTPEVRCFARSFLTVGIGEGFRSSVPIKAHPWCGEG